MSLSTDNGELCPGSRLSVSQLLGVAKRKLRGSAFGLRCVEGHHHPFINVFKSLKRELCRSVTTMGQPEVRGTEKQLKSLMR